MANHIQNNIRCKKTNIYEINCYKHQPVRCFSIDFDWIFKSIGTIYKPCTKCSLHHLSLIYIMYVFIDIIDISINICEIKMIFAC